VFEYAIYHDNPEAGLGYGFKSSRNWELVWCDRDDDGDFDADDLGFSPPSHRRQLVDDPGDWDSGFVVLAQNVITSTECGGKCESELITTLFVNLDTDCDGDIEDEGDIFQAYTNGGVCFYAEAQAPGRGLPMWKGNPQARITAGGGQKNVNFSVLPAATAITLGSFTARWAEASSQPVISWVAIALFGGAALGVVIWRLRPARR